MGRADRQNAHRLQLAGLPGGHQPRARDDRAAHHRHGQALQPPAPGAHDRGVASLAPQGARKPQPRRRQHHAPQRVRRRLHGRGRRQQRRGPALHARARPVPGRNRRLPAGRGRRGRPHRAGPSPPVHLRPAQAPEDQHPHHQRLQPHRGRLPRQRPRPLPRALPALPGAAAAGLGHRQAPRHQVGPRHRRPRPARHRALRVPRLRRRDPRAPQARHAGRRALGGRPPRRRGWARARLSAQQPLQPAGLAQLGHPRARVGNRHRRRPHRRHQPAARVRQHPPGRNLRGARRPRRRARPAQARRRHPPARRHLGATTS